MKKAKQFPFKNMRRITPEEVLEGQKAIESLTGKARVGRPFKFKEKLEAISIKLHPKILIWAKKEAKKKGIGYQSFLNTFLMKKAA